MTVGAVYDPTTLPAEQRRMLEAVLPVWEEGCQGTPREEIIFQLARLSAHHAPDLPETAWTILYEDYADDLAHVPPDILATAIRTWRQTQKWWPKVSELLAIANPPTQARLRERNRMRKLLGVRSPEERTAVIVAGVADALRMDRKTGPAANRAG